MFAADTADRRQRRNRGPFDSHKPCRIQLYYRHRDNLMAKAQGIRRSLSFALLSVISAWVVLVRKLRLPQLVHASAEGTTLSHFPRPHLLNAPPRCTSWLNAP